MLKFSYRLQRLLFLKLVSPNDEECRVGGAELDTAGRVIKRQRPQGGNGLRFLAHFTGFEMSDIFSALDCVEDKCVVENCNSWL